MNITYQIKILLLIVWGLLCCSCAYKADKLSLSDGNRDKIKAEIAHLVPIGSSVSLAKKTMESEGFNCELVQKGEFSEYGDDTKGHPINEINNIDYLYCDKVIKGFISGTRWQIAFVQRDNIITNVMVRYRRMSL